MNYWTFNWELVTTSLVSLVAAYVLAAVIGFNREKSARSAGLRTFPLVAIGTCAFAMVGVEVFEGEDAVSRVLYGIIAGMGFIGGGAILKRDDGVAGMATAASIWNTGAIGVAVGLGRIDVAVIVALISILTLVVGDYIKKVLGIGQSDD